MYSNIFPFNTLQVLHHVKNIFKILFIDIQITNLEDIAGLMPISHYLNTECFGKKASGMPVSLAVSEILPGYNIVGQGHYSVVEGLITVTPCHYTTTNPT